MSNGAVGMDYFKLIGARLKGRGKSKRAPTRRKNSLQVAIARGKAVNVEEFTETSEETNENEIFRSNCIDVYDKVFAISKSACDGPEVREAVIKLLSRGHNSNNNLQEQVAAYLAAGDGSNGAEAHQEAVKNIMSAAHDMAAFTAAAKGLSAVALGEGDESDESQVSSGQQLRTKLVQREEELKRRSKDWWSTKPTKEPTKQSVWLKLAKYLGGAAVSFCDNWFCSWMVNEKATDCGFMQLLANSKYKEAAKLLICRLTCFWTLLTTFCGLVEFASHIWAWWHGTDRESVGLADTASLTGQAKRVFSYLVGNLDRLLSWICSIKATWVGSILKCICKFPLEAFHGMDEDVTEYIGEDSKNPLKQDWRGLFGLRERGNELDWQYSLMHGTGEATADGKERFTGYKPGVFACLQLPFGLSGESGWEQYHRKLDAMYSNPNSFIKEACRASAALQAMEDVHGINKGLGAIAETGQHAFCNYATGVGIAGAGETGGLSLLLGTVCHASAPFLSSIFAFFTHGFLGEVFCRFKGNYPKKMMQTILQSEYRYSVGGMLDQQFSMYMNGLIMTGVMGGFGGSMAYIGHKIRKNFQGRTGQYIAGVVDRLGDNSEEFVSHARDSFFRFNHMRGQKHMMKTVLTDKVANEFYTAACNSVPEEQKWLALQKKYREDNKGKEYADERGVSNMAKDFMSLANQKRIKVQKRNMQLGYNPAAIIQNALVANSLTGDWKNMSYNPNVYKTGDLGGGVGYFGQLVCRDCQRLPKYQEYIKKSEELEDAKYAKANFKKPKKTRKKKNPDYTKRRKRRQKQSAQDKRNEQWNIQEETSLSEQDIKALERDVAALAKEARLIADACRDARHRSENAFQAIDYSGALRKTIYRTVEENVKPLKEAAAETMLPKLKLAMELFIRQQAYKLPDKLPEDQSTESTLKRLGKRLRDWTGFTVGNTSPKMTMTMWTLGEMLDGRKEEDKTQVEKFNIHPFNSKKFGWPLTLVLVGPKMFEGRQPLRYVDLDKLTYDQLSMLYRRCSLTPDYRKIWAEVNTRLVQKGEDYCTCKYDEHYPSSRIQFEDNTKPQSRKEQLEAMCENKRDKNKLVKGVHMSWCDKCDTLLKVGQNWFHKEGADDDDYCAKDFEGLKNKEGYIQIISPELLGKEQTEYVQAPYFALSEAAVAAAVNDDDDNE